MDKCKFCSACPEDYGMNEDLMQKPFLAYSHHGKFEGIIVELFIYGNSLGLYSELTETFGEMKINYCPMCGRKLTENGKVLWSDGEERVDE